MLAESEGKHRNNLFIVLNEYEGKVITKALKLLHETGYSIAVLPVKNNGKLYSDDIIFAKGEELSPEFIEKMENEYEVWGMKDVYAFFSMDFSQFDKVILCHTNTIWGKLQKCILSYKFNKENVDLYEMDLSCAANDAKKYGFESSSRVSIYNLPPYVIAAVNPVRRIEKCGDVGYQAWRWENLTRNQTGLCICDEGDEIFNVPTDIYDNLLLSHTPDDSFVHIARPVGYALANLPNMGDWFLIDRMFELADLGKVQFKQRDDRPLTKSERHLRKLHPDKCQGVYVNPWYDVLVRRSVVSDEKL